MTVPTILVVLGWLTIMGNWFIEALMGAPQDPILGYFMIGTGILLYIAEIYVIR
jgi:hypothetical protein